MDSGGTAFRSVAYHLSSRLTSFPIVTRTCLKAFNSLVTISVGIGLKKMENNWEECTYGTYILFHYMYHEYNLLYFLPVAILLGAKIDKIGSHRQFLTIAKL